MDDDFDTEWLQNEDPGDRGDLFRERYGPRIVEEFRRTHDTEWLQDEDPQARGEVLERVALDHYHQTRKR